MRVRRACTCCKAVRSAWRSRARWRRSWDRDGHVTLSYSSKWKLGVLDMISVLLSQFCLLYLIWHNIWAFNLNWRQIVRVKAIDCVLWFQLHQRAILSSPSNRQETVPRMLECSVPARCSYRLSTTSSSFSSRSHSYPRSLSFPQIYHWTFLKPCSKSHQELYVPKHEVQRLNRFTSEASSFTSPPWETNNAAISTSL